MRDLKFYDLQTKRKIMQLEGLNSLKNMASFKYLASLDELLTDKMLI